MQQAEVGLGRIDFWACDISEVGCFCMKYDEVSGSCGGVSSYYGIVGWD